VTQNPVRRLLEALLIARPQQRVQQDVVGLQRGVGFQFAAPVALFVLLGEQPFARRRDGRAHAAGQFLNFAEAKLWGGT